MTRGRRIKWVLQEVFRERKKGMFENGKERREPPLFVSCTP